MKVLKQAGVVHDIKSQQTLRSVIIIPTVHFRYGILSTVGI